MPENEIIIKRRPYRKDLRLAEVVRLSTEAAIVLANLTFKHDLPAKYIASELIVQGAKIAKFDD